MTFKYQSSSHSLAACIILLKHPVYSSNRRCIRQQFIFLTLIGIFLFFTVKIQRGCTILRKFSPRLPRSSIKISTEDIRSPWLISCQLHLNQQRSSKLNFFLSVQTTVFHSVSHDMSCCANLSLAFTWWGWNIGLIFIFPYFMIRTCWRTHVTVRELTFKFSAFRMWQDKAPVRDVSGKMGILFQSVVFGCQPQHFFPLNRRIFN